MPRNPILITKAPILLVCETQLRLGGVEGCEKGLASGVEGINQPLVSGPLTTHIA